MKQPTGTIRVCIMASLNERQVQQEWLDVAVDAQVRDALHQSQIAKAWHEQYPELKWSVGVWSAKVRLDAPLHDGDQVELYRPLRVDPKVARRERFRKQGARATGLFANKRAGAKSGY